MAISSAYAANILLVFRTASWSHQTLGNEIAKALVKKCHHITMIVLYSIGGDVENYTQIVLKEIVEYKENT